MKLLHDAVDRILVAHRNTKIFMFICSGPFLVLYMLAKLAIKLSIIYFFYESHGKLTHKSEKE